MLSGGVPGITPIREHEEDYIAVGMEALCRCCRDFDPSYGVPFGNYASRAIINNIKLYHRYQILRPRTNNSTIDPTILSSAVVDPKAQRDDRMDKFPCRIAELMGDLSERELDMVEFLLSGHSQSDYARLHSITPQMASIVAKRCVRKMKQFAIEMGYEVDGE
jgi:hypothetical protein